MNLKLISEILIVLGFISMQVATLMKEKKNILGVELIDKVLKIIAYLLVGEINAAEASGLNGTRNTISLLFKNKSKRVRNIAYIGFLIIIPAIFLSTYSGVKTILGLAAAIFNAIAVFYGNEQWIRRTRIIVSLCLYTPFLAMSGTVSGVVCELIGCCMNIFSNLKYKKYYAERDKKEPLP